MNSTLATANTGQPTIASVTPSSAVIGSSPTVSVSGTFLVGADAQPSVSTNDGNLQFSVAQADSRNVQLNSSISSTANPTTDSFTLTTAWGSATGNFTITCGTPQISAVTPPSVNAGQTVTHSP